MGNAQKTMQANFSGYRPFLNLLLFMTIATYGVGLFGPLFSVSKFFVFSNTVSLASGLQDLFREKEMVLFALIFGFSVVFPILKLGLLFRILNGQNQNRKQQAHQLHLLAQFGKWSMLDVFVVAVMLVGLKLGPIANVKIYYGLYAFAGSVILSMLITAMVKALATEANPKETRKEGKKILEPGIRENRKEAKKVIEPSIRENRKETKKYGKTEPV
jgi:paraquat-inducible protein A